MHRLFALIFTAVLVAGCGVPGIGGEDCNDAVAEQLDGFYDEWQDALELASSTSRIALGDRVADLQRIRREVERQDWPDCADDAHSSLVSGMDHTIKAFRLFMAQEPDSEVEKEFK